MKKIIKYILPLAMFFAACEDMVTDVDVPASESHYVLHAYLSPEDSVVKVKVDFSAPVFGDPTIDTSFISHSRVYINNYELTRIPATNEFSASAADFPIVPGQEYTVVLMIDGVKACQGSCKVPDYVNQSLVFEGVDSTDNGEEYNVSYEAKFSFTDIPVIENYYRISVQIKYTEYMGDTLTYDEYPEASNFIKDLTFDGEVYKGRIALNSGIPLSMITGFTLSLYTTDKEYYNYHRAVLSQTGDDPFSEPVIVPSNIENGLGCVAAYRVYSIEAQ